MSERETANQILNGLYESIPRDFMDDIGVASKGMGFVLIYLSGAKGETVSGDIARELGVSTARVAVLLGSMEKYGYITRKKEGRRTVVGITPLGMEYAEKIREQIVSQTVFLIQKLGTDDFYELIRILTRIKTTLSGRHG